MKIYRIFKKFNQSDFLIMAFNELNSVEHYIIHELSGVNLNADNVPEISEPKIINGYTSPQVVFRESTQVLVERTSGCLNFKL